MGGMAAQIPIRNDPEANQTAMEKVRRDKLREVKAGHDGTWVARPGLVKIARDVFDEHMAGANQIGSDRLASGVTAGALLAVPAGEITEEGLRLNIDIGIRYSEAWLSGNGCVPLDSLIEDAATAEISRTQVWQWIRHGSRTSGGTQVTPKLIRRRVEERLRAIRAEIGRDRYDSSRFGLAAELFLDLAMQTECPEFLTLAAYEHLD